MASVAWRIQWRGKEWEVRWEDGVLHGGAAAEAFGRFAGSNAPTTTVPVEHRLASADAMREIIPQFADAILSAHAEE